MRLLRILLCLGIALTISALINEADAAQKIKIDNIAGVYKNKHKIGFVGEENLVTVEDVLEIVKYSPNEAYIRTRLLFYNGHSCSLYGIAKVEGKALVYREPVDADMSEPRIVAAENQCVLTLNFSDEGVKFGDLKNRCAHKTCGARGLYESRHAPAFMTGQRRKIRYMRSLLGSNQYCEAVERHGDTCKVSALSHSGG